MRPARILLLVVVAVSVTAPQTASAVTVRDGLATRDEVPGARAASPVSTRRWTPVRGRQATRTFRSAGARGTVVVSHAVLVRSASAGSGLARLLRRRLPRAAVWHDGALVGAISVTGLPRAGADRLAAGVAAAIAGRLKAERAKTAWDRVTTLKGARGPTTRQAAQAFSMAFERLPGVKAPRAAVDRPADGTLALQWALARRRSMTAAQRKVVLRWAGWLHGARDAGAAHAALESDWAKDTALTAEAKAQAAALAAKLGFPLTVSLAVGRTGHAPANPGDLAVTESTAADGSSVAGAPVSCWITVFQGGSDTTGVFRSEIFAHEVFHCYQAQMAGEIARIADRFTNGTTWWVEGGADWAACNAVPAPVPEPALADWEQTPGTALPVRAYDGVGLFTLLAGQVGVNLWPRWPAIVKTVSTDAAITAAAGPQYDALRRVWASSTYQEVERGTAWDIAFSQPCVPDPAISIPQDLELTDGTSDVLHADAWTAKLYALHSDADVVHFKVADGDVRLSSRTPHVDEPNLHDRYFCTDDATDCTCPAGSSRAGPPPQRIEAKGGGTVLAITGGRSGATGTVEGMTREDYCGVKLGLIVPGRSIGDAYLGQSRKSVLRKVDGLVPIEHGFTTKNANGLLLKGDGLIGIVFQIHFGLCSSPALENGGAAACKQQFPQSTPDQVASVQTSSPGYTTRDGLGPGSDAAAVVGAVGAGNCEREDGTPAEEQPWHVCHVPAATGGATTWGFTTNAAGSNYVLAVTVYNPRAFPD